MVDWTAELFNAVLEGDISRVENSISNGADLSAIFDECDILSSAIAWTADTNQQIIKLLIEAGANPNLLGYDGTTALYWAASANDVELVRTLINAGARVDAEKPKDGYTSLHAASEQGNLENIELLLKVGGESALNRFDYIAHTPLMWAAEKGDIDIARALIKAGSDVNAHDESRIGDTALLIAAEQENFEMARLLVESGADPTIPGWMGITALSVVQNPATPEKQRIFELFKEITGRQSAHGET